MQNKSNITEQKLRGGYYTPYPMAMYLWNWIKEKNLSTVLEPSAGDGALLLPAFKERSNVSFTAIELLKEESKKIADNYKDRLDVTVINDDFYDWYQEPSDLYDAVISNPPYIRYQYLTAMQRDIQSEILISNGLKPNKLINAWVAFTIASISKVKSGGRVGFVLPTDLLQVSYAKQLREYLINSLSKMFVVTFKESAFSALQQDTLLLLGEVGKSETEFKHISATSIDNIPSWNSVQDTVTPVDNSGKWKKLFLSTEESLIIDDYIDNTSIGFNKLAKTEVGVTTGANTFFSLTDNTVSRLKARKFVNPLLGRSISTSGIFFEDSDISRNVKTDNKVWILNLSGTSYVSLPKEIRNYIEEAENKGINSAYKLRIRDEWYKIPGIWFPDAFLLRRIGEMPRLILNKVHATSTDTFHRVSFMPNINNELVTFMFYSSPTLVSIELAGRSFAGGALELLPGDMKSLHLPRINYMDRSVDIANELEKLNNLVKNRNYNEATLFVDDILKSKFNYTYPLQKTYDLLQRLRKVRIK